MKTPDQRKPAPRRSRRAPKTRPGETWRPLAGWGAPYDVSDLGRVRKPAVAVERRRGGTQHYKAQLLSAYLRKATPMVQLLLRPGRHRAIRVARLVAAAFLPPRPPGAVLVCMNGDSGDVRAANLGWSRRPVHARIRTAPPRHAAAPAAEIRPRTTRTSCL